MPVGDDIPVEIDKSEPIFFAYLAVLARAADVLHHGVLRRIEVQDVEVQPAHARRAARALLEAVQRRGALPHLVELPRQLQIHRTHLCCISYVLVVSGCAASWSSAATIPLAMLGRRY